MEFEYRAVRTEEDIREAFGVYESNREYFEIVSHKEPGIGDVRRDMVDRPEGLEAERKFYGLFLLDGEVVGLEDILAGFPERDVLYIGLFMIRGERHREGLGRELIGFLERKAREQGYGRIRLGVVEENRKGLAFWESMGFVRLKRVESCGNPDVQGAVLVMVKDLT